MEGSTNRCTNRCTKVQWRKGSCRVHFWKRSKFFVKSRIMASSCHNLNIQIGLQRNRLGGEEVVSKANLQIVNTDWKTIQADLINRYVDSLPSTVPHLLALPPFFCQKTVCACLLVDVQLSNCSTGTSRPLTVAFHLQIGRRLKHICPSSQHIWLLYLYYTAMGATILVL